MLEQDQVTRWCVDVDNSSRESARDIAVPPEIIIGYTGETSQRAWRVVDIIFRTVKGSSIFVASGVNFTTPEVSAGEKLDEGLLDQFM